MCGGTENVKNRTPIVEGYEVGDKCCQGKRGRENINVDVVGLVDTCGGCGALRTTVIFFFRP
jgi:hypothetical protein